jgi:hypothetical protein
MNNYNLNKKLQLINILIMVCFAQNGLASRGSPSMQYCSEKSISVKQIEDNTGI